LTPALNLIRTHWREFITGLCATLAAFVSIPAIGIAACAAVRWAFPEFFA